MLKRAGISWKRARQYIYSPDPLYAAKVAHLASLLQQVAASGGREVLVYLDEVSTYRQPTLAQAYEQCGQAQPRAFRSYKADTLTRIIASLDHKSGQVVYLRANQIKLAQLVAFYQKLGQAYPQAERIYVVQDNWPVHFHPDVLVALEPQESALGQWHRPGNWSSEASAAAKRKWGELHLPVQIVTLPTYASWLNPIEKLWRWLKQSLLHLHHLADHLELLRAEMDHFLDQFVDGSIQLLRYVGLYAD